MVSWSSTQLTFTCSNSTVETLEKVEQLIVNSEHILHLFVVFLSLNLNKSMLAGKFYVNPFQPSVAFNTETSHLICSPKQMTDFCMKRNTGLKWVNPYPLLSFKYKRPLLF